MGCASERPCLGQSLVLEWWGENWNLDIGMLNIVMIEPEIPHNAGAAGRLALATGARLHLVKPLGFSLDDKHMRRAGLDYHEYAPLHRHASWDALLQEQQPDPRRMFALTTRGTRSPYQLAFLPGDWLVFGSETRGLPESVRDGFAPDQRLRLAIRDGQRSLNLSNAVAVTVFEAWRQNGFAAVTDGAGP